MYRIAKQFTFSASHSLNGLRADHPCARDHGHNYTVEFILRSEDLDRHGFVADFRSLDWLKEWIDKHLDHRNLNAALSQIVGREFQTTSENLAQFFYALAKRGIAMNTAPQVECVRVSETEKTWAEYRPSPDRDEMAMRFMDVIGTTAVQIKKVVKDALEREQ
jgi:6-pyruvoyltetrahydropterin/6-carboxytetrahydropterin synthase